MGLVGWGDLDAALRRLERHGMAAARESVALLMDNMRTTTGVVLSLQEHPPFTKTPSRPGQPPARISGRLSMSLRTRGPRRVGQASYRGEVGPTTVYSRIQELGGACGKGHRTHLPPRPYMSPSWLMVRRTASQAVREAWNKTG